MSDAGKMSASLKEPKPQIIQWTCLRRPCKHCKAHAQNVDNNYYKLLVVTLSLSLYTCECFDFLNFHPVYWLMKAIIF